MELAVLIEEVLDQGPTTKSQLLRRMRLWKGAPEFRAHRVLDEMIGDGRVVECATATAERVLHLPGKPPKVDKGVVATATSDGVTFRRVRTSTTDQDGR